MGLITSMEWVVHDSKDNENYIDSWKSDEKTVKEAAHLHPWDDDDRQNVTNKAKNSQRSLENKIGNVKALSIPSLPGEHLQTRICKY